jgi:uncharacterized membrane protein YdjX (TVP38/TMEM64 family)
MTTSTKGKTGKALKAAMLVMFIAAAIFLVRFTPVSDWLTPARLTGFIENAGVWAPIVYILGYATGVCLFVPGTLLAVIGATVFGPYLGFAYVWIGAMIGSSLAFLIGRYLGRDFAASLIGNRLKRYDQAIERNGFATTLYLRLVYFPFNVMNFGMGLTGVKFRDYFFGTALGILVGTFIFTFAIGTLRDIWLSGRWGDLLGWKVLFSLGLFVFSFFIPTLIKRIKGDRS